MVWAKVSDTFYDDPAMLGLPRDDRLFYVEATTWACKHETDGVFPLASVGRFSDTPEPAQTLARLVDAGLVEVLTDARFELVGFLDDQRSKVDIDKDRAEARFRQRRKRLHDKGDHSTCTRGSKFCPAGQLEHVSRRDEPAKSRPPVPTRPDLQGGRGGTSGADAPPPQRSGAVTPQEAVLHILEDAAHCGSDKNVVAEAVAEFLTLTEVQRSAPGRRYRAMAAHTQAALEVLRNPQPQSTQNQLAGDLVRAVLAVPGTPHPAPPRANRSATPTERVLAVLNWHAMPNLQHPLSGCNPSGVGRKVAEALTQDKALIVKLLPVAVQEIDSGVRSGQQLDSLAASLWKRLEEANAELEAVNAVPPAPVSKPVAPWGKTA